MFLSTSITPMAIPLLLARPSESTLLFNSLSLSHTHTRTHTQQPPTRTLDEFSLNREICVGIADVKYYDAELIKCKDGSKSFTRDRLNDDFCDCADGTDEPGTSACPASKFYCRNTGSTPRFLFSSRVNDQICDCCDGSDEYDGSIKCRNTCIMGGNIVYQKQKYDSKSNLDSINSRKTKPGNQMEDSSQKLKGLKALVFLQVGLVISFMIFCFFRRRKSRRRHFR